jgi:3-methyladenine DNA glycosylase AlkD
MNVKEILLELERFGDAQTKKTLAKHGAKEPFFGVKVEQLKTILKKTKKNHELSLELYKTGNSDAMYLAGLMADESKITEAQLNEWVEKNGLNRLMKILQSQVGLLYHHMLV